jgi:carbon monoxide dehydrogenase subunit G
VELTNEFTVGVPIEQAWAVLTDVERIAPCMPGAQLQEVEGDEYRGVVKVKVGPITAQYKGAATFVEKDDANHKVVLRAEGRDTRGQGNASATITAELVPDGEGTKVTVLTDLTVTGKVAQFGRGVLADVSGKLLTQFVDCLHDDVLSADATAPAAEAAETVAPASAAAPTATEAPPSTGPRKIEHRETAPVDILQAAGNPVAKRIGPILGILIVVLWLLRRQRRKKR